MKNKLFTISDKILRDPRKSYECHEKEIETQVKNKKLYIIGKKQVGDVKKIVYCRVPFHKMRSDIFIEKINDNLTISQQRFIKKILTKEIIKKSLKEAEKRLKVIIDIHDGGARSGLKSDNFSTLFGTCFSKIIKDVFKIPVEISGNDNRKSDIYFPNIDLKIEIKATSTKTSWTGGKLSDRPYPTILISYDAEKSKYFVALLPKINWPKGSEKYYGPSLTWADFRDNYPEKVILFANIGDDGQIMRESLD
jgi:hypothetical protein